MDQQWTSISHGERCERNGIDRSSLMGRGTQTPTLGEGGIGRHTRDAKEGMKGEGGVIKGKLNIYAV